jgi:hypothetical protein
MTRSPVGWVVACAIASAVSVGAAVVAAVPSSDLVECRGAVTTDIRDGHAVCVHASERPPPGVDLKRRPTTEELKRRRFGESKRAPSVPGTESGPTVAASGGSVACIGDGVEGERVQAIYAHASDIADRFGSVAELIRQYAADADYQVNVSAGASDQGRRIRYATESCSLSIARATLTTTGDDTFSAMRQQLQAQGFNRGDRKYLVWMDASVGICGLGELYADDRASVDNANNGGPSYARVDASCWGYAEAHELLHTLGAVQDSAPHSTGAGHCVDENDTMCYSDTSGVAMTSACPSFPSWQVDCSLDDYFNAAPAPVGYLASHWNVANSGFLEGAPPLPPPPSVSVSAPGSLYAGNAMGVRADVTIPAGRTYTVQWTSSRSDCKFFNAVGPTNIFYCPVTSAGSGQITARVTDSLGMSSSASRTYSLTTPSRRRTTTATLRSSRTTIRRGARLTLTGKLVDASTGKAVIGMRVSIYYRRAGATSWTKLTTRTTNRNGTLSLTVRPSRTTTYMLVSWYTSTWASDRSNTRRISVR